MNLRRKLSGEEEPKASSSQPDMVLEINDLWTQRFEDNEFRARQRLSGKILRVTGLLDTITGESMFLYGVGKTRDVRMTASLERVYSSKIQAGLATLEKGVTLTVQGKFVYDRVELSDALIVDKATGSVFSVDQIRAIGDPGAISVGSPPAPKPSK